LPPPTTAEALGTAGKSSAGAMPAMVGASGGSGLDAALARVDASKAAGVGACVPPLGFAQADATTTQATQRMPRNYPKRHWFGGMTRARTCSKLLGAPSRSAFAAKSRRYPSLGDDHPRPGVGGVWDQPSSDVGWASYVMRRRERGGWVTRFASSSCSRQPGRTATREKCGAVATAKSTQFLASLVV
jgi:hypothetical protein